MNRKGFTLVEVLMAAAIFITTLSCFSCMLKVSSNYVKKTSKISQALSLARCRMEELWQVSPSAEISAVQVEVGNLKLYSLRSKY